MLSIREVIVVEGKYDRIRLQSVVRGTIVETHGFRIFQDPEQRELLRRMGMERGLILLTDSDSAGFVIRSHLNGLLPPEKIKHAYIPSVKGREKRKTADSKEGLLGVEGMEATVLEEAFRRAGATILNEDEKPDKGGDRQSGFLSGWADRRSRQRGKTAAAGAGAGTARVSVHRPAAGRGQRPDDKRGIQQDDGGAALNTGS